VRSASDPEVVYTITAEGCDCPDAQKAPVGRSKHYWAVILTATAQQSQAYREKEAARGND